MVSIFHIGWMITRIYDDSLYFYHISDSILQENQLANGIERANKAEVYTGK